MADSCVDVGETDMGNEAIIEGYRKYDDTERNEPLVFSNRPRVAVSDVGLTGY